MADSYLKTNEQALADATVARAQLAASVLRVFDATLIPEVTTTSAQMVAKETTLVGYPAGGYPLATFGPPLKVESGTYGITTPLVPIVYASGAGVAMGGAWIEDAAGDARQTFVFDPPISLSVVGDGIEFVRTLLYG